MLKDVVEQGEQVIAGPERAMPRVRKTRAIKRPTWSDVKANLAMMDRIGLVALIRDLYNLDALNRRALQARFSPSSTIVDQYRRLVRAAVFPDPLSQRPVRLRDATATIRQYTRATGDVAGTIDLMLEFVEAGTEQAADLGYGDDAYFTALEHKVNEVVRLLNDVPTNERRPLTERVCRLGAYQGAIGWGYDDFLADVAAKVAAREDRSRRPRAGRGGRTDGRAG
jgi:hypothetical protein